jgi:GSCFA family
LSTHPYKPLPDKAFWRRSVAGVPAHDVDPVGAFALRITPETKVATAGSCFAQHIARHLRAAGFNYYVVEPGHPILPREILEKHNYGLFSARYGNIYTARQLWQLLRRAYGEFSPEEDAWVEADSSVKDPFRPTTQPQGFVSIAEMHADRKQHLAAVREMFETLDVFVFTLGLTECWISRADGAVFPLCPGVEGGVFDAKKHGFYNQTVEDVVADMSAFLDRLSAINEAAKVILTVSPVPLMATAEPEAHVLAATTYSKAVLRVAAELLCKRYKHVHYFPSYEIITGSFSRGRYYSDDLRNVTEEGVSHVMRLFLEHATGREPASAIEEPQVKPPDDFVARAQGLVEVECDEVALDRPQEPPSRPPDESP